MRTATIGHFTGQVVHGLWGGGAGQVVEGAVEGVGAGQAVQGLWRGRGWHFWPAACSLVWQLTASTRHYLVSRVEQFLKVIKLVLLRDDKQIKFCRN